jgi:hypothetical protein
LKNYHEVTETHLYCCRFDASSLLVI